MAEQNVLPLYSMQIAGGGFNDGHAYWDSWFWKENTMGLGVVDGAEAYHPLFHRAIVQFDLSDVSQLLGSAPLQLKGKIASLGSGTPTWAAVWRKGRNPSDSNYYSTSWQTAGRTNYLGNDAYWAKGRLKTAADASDTTIYLDDDANMGAYSVGMHVAFEPLTANAESRPIQSIDTENKTLTFLLGLTYGHAAGTLVRTRCVVTTVDQNSFGGNTRLYLASTTGMSVGDWIAKLDVSGSADHYWAEIDSISAGAYVEQTAGNQVMFVNGDRVAVFAPGDLYNWGQDGGDFQGEEPWPPLNWDKPSTDQRAADIYWKMPTTGWTNPDTSSAWAAGDEIRIGYDSNTLLSAVSGTTSSNVSYPTDEANSWVKLDGSYASGWQIGKTFTLDGTDYTVVDVGGPDESWDRTLIRVDANVSSVGQSKSYTIAGQTASDQIDKIRECVQDCESDFGTAPTRLYIWGMLEGREPHADIPDDDVPGEQYQETPEDASHQALFLYASHYATSADQFQFAVFPTDLVTLRRRRSTT